LARPASPPFGAVIGFVAQALERLKAVMDPSQVPPGKWDGITATATLVTLRWPDIAKKPLKTVKNQIDCWIDIFATVAKKACADGNLSCSISAESRCHCFALAHAGGTAFPGSTGRRIRTLASIACASLIFVEAR
jgi:hypothetical protein